MFWPGSAIIRENMSNTKQKVLNFYIWIIALSLPTFLLLCTVFLFTAQLPTQVCCPWRRHHAVCLLTGPMPFWKQILQTVWSTVSPFNFQHPLPSLRTVNSCLRLLPCLLVPSIFSSTTSFIRQFLCKMWPNPLAFLLSLYVGYSLHPQLCVILLHWSHVLSSWPSPSFSSTTLQNFQGISHLRRLFGK